MTVFAVRLPDVGEGVAEAELVEWHVNVGDAVTSESVLAEVLTDKATVEISSPVAGVVSYLRGEPGERLAVGTEFVGVELGDGAAPPSERATPPTVSGVHSAPATPRDNAPAGSRPAAAPTVRRRARELGIDLSTIRGSGPAGRIAHADLDRQTSAAASDRHPAHDSPRVEQVRGLRRRIAERLTKAWTEIPHITYVDEVDATEVQALRKELNRREHGDRRLTLLPFVVRALVIACREQPRLNATYDAANEELFLHEPIHVGIATQTPDGLVVPVVRHAEARGLWDLVSEIGRLADAARTGTATREELSGSTITITSLGALGGLATTPIINQPEVAIIGINKMQTRPVWREGTFVPRQIFNVSSSFDHRIVDGWDAATFVQRLKTLIEMPALLFVDDAG